MDILHIKATKQTPEVFLDGKNGIFKISGKSYPENVNIFYKPIFEYINDFKETPSSSIKLEFNWLYYNTATNKMVMRIIMLLKEIDENLKIFWFYNEGFEMIMEKGQEIKDILGIQMNIEQI